MLGLLFGLLHVGTRGAEIGSRIHDEHKSKNEAIKSGRDWYLDRNGMTRRLCDSKPTVTKHDNYGDLVELNPYTSEIYENISFEKRKRHEEEMNVYKEKAVKEGKKYYLYDTNYSQRPHYPWYIPNLSLYGNKGYTSGLKDQIISGRIWKSVDSGKMYIRRYISIYDCIRDEEEDGGYSDFKKKYNDCNPRSRIMVLVSLANGEIQPNILGWKNLKTNTPSEQEKERAQYIINKLNIKNKSGAYIHRSTDQWLNRNETILEDREEVF